MTVVRKERTGSTYEMREHCNAGGLWGGIVSARVIAVVMVIKILPVSGPNSAKFGQAKKQMYWLSSLKKRSTAASRLKSCCHDCFAPSVVSSFVHGWYPHSGELSWAVGRWFPGRRGPVLRGRSLGLRVEYSLDRQGDEAHWVQVLELEKKEFGHEGEWREGTRESSSPATSRGNP